MKLHNYFRSSASYRVRIALNLKGLEADYVPVHLIRNGGEQLAAAFRVLSPDAIVPVLEDQGHALDQSLAIIEYLEEIHPRPALLPAAPIDRAYVRAIALQIACEIHPIDNLRVLKHLTETFGASDQQKNEWYRHWIGSGFAALERRLANDPRTGPFAFGEQPTLADLCIVPQVFNAVRFKVDMSAFPTIARINDTALQLPAFADAAPGRQPDAE